MDVISFGRIYCEYKFSRIAFSLLLKDSSFDLPTCESIRVCTSCLANLGFLFLFP